ncbi:MAG: RluA family pseudouridine synthase [Rhodospirillaceae bacterium]
MSETLLTCTIPDDATNDRLDKALAALLADLSRSRLRMLLDQGHVRCGGATITDPSQRVKPGQIFVVFVPDPEPATPEAQALPLVVVYEDEDVLVIDKPAGMVVHPAPGSPDMTLVNALLAHCGDRLSGIGGVRRPGIVHRLDKDTSGLIAVAKSDRAHAGLSAQFESRTIRRTYSAVVRGLPLPREGVVNAAIGRSEGDRKKMAVVTRGGKAAITRYRVLESFGSTAALVECRLETGRTHQIRVHLASIGHSLIGDPLYGRGRAGGKLPAFSRQALHAHRLEFLHPVGGAALAFEAPLPADMTELIELLRSAVLR